ncbi:MAG TPA: carboxypeptidase-like regulatory domain-containing protein [Vicinamibacteria bacterium]|nr:carboxypeptidase-like regulatory domain-containing protein [Vicinamibacteria bacterium]
MNARRVGVALTLVVPALILAACGGPSSPSSEEGISLQGTFVGAGAASASSAGRAGSVASTITVTVVENPSIVVTVGADGRFSLRGLPAGGFTLLFTADGVRVGTLSFAELKPNQEITLTVRLEGGTIVLVEERRDGIGHGDTEIEGQVDAVNALNPAGESIFVINGRTVVARPGETTIREGNRSRSVNDVTVGRQVHVKGTFIVTSSRTNQMVLAHEIILQGDDDGSAPVPPRGSCAVGSNAEVEGLITGKGASSVTVTQQGKGDYLCLVSSSTRIRKGNTTYTFAQLQGGWRVHVKGTQQGMAGNACQVSASEIKVQQN